jgi:hypothetical protein
MGFPSLSTFKSMYASNPLIILDTNMYLNLLQYSKNASIEMRELFDKISNDIFVPQQVRKEFNKNLQTIVSNRTSNIKQTKTKIKLNIESCKDNIIKQLNFLIKHRFDQSQEVASKAAADFQMIKSYIEEYISNFDSSDSDAFLSGNDVDAFFQSLCLSDTQPYSPSRLFDIYKNGYIRYKYKIPPGYMDDPQNNSKSNKEGVAVFGDLILWNQIIDIAISQNRAVVFVTADNKEDWFELRGNRPTAPRSELISEFEEQTTGGAICILTDELFAEYFSDILSIDMGTAILEMQMDNFVETTIHNKQSKILDSVIEWANKGENILQLPFTYKAEQLVNISNPRIVVKNVAIQTGDNIKYIAMLNGTADFIGSYYDEDMQRHVPYEQEASFLFDLRISLLRQFVETKEGRVPSKEIADISVDGVSFEAISSGDIPLESKRGVFITLNEDDYEIHDYMQSIWNSYEEKHSINDAEAFVYFNTANHFELSLLEVNRAFTLVQNHRLKLNLSINEIDALALKRFSDINILTNNEGFALFKDKSALLGEAYPTPEDMLVSPPEANKEIEVYFSCEIERPEGKYVQVVGTTNLPENTTLMITFSSKEHSYMAQAKTSVLLGGAFTSDVFVNVKNKNNVIVNGVYTISITVPIISVQPDSVKVLMGKKGRNLLGKYVEEDAIFGKTVHYLQEVQVT